MADFVGSFDTQQRPAPQNMFARTAGAAKKFEFYRSPAPRRMRKASST
ncbi:hypothetical protein [Pseudaminobacter soli (ex Li et al. 2025)]|nr:hypothetical protein [Mesorhizobium soli]